MDPYWDNRSQQVQVAVLFKNFGFRSEIATWRRGAFLRSVSPNSSLSSRIATTSCAARSGSLLTAAHSVFAAQKSATDDSFYPTAKVANIRLLLLFLSPRRIGKKFPICEQLVLFPTPHCTMNNGAIGKGLPKFLNTLRRNKSTANIQVT